MALCDVHRHVEQLGKAVDQAKINATTSRAIGRAAGGYGGLRSPL